MNFAINWFSVLVLVWRINHGKFSLVNLIITVNWHDYVLPYFMLSIDQLNYSKSLLGVTFIWNSKLEDYDYIDINNWIKKNYHVYHKVTLVKYEKEKLMEQLVNFSYTYNYILLLNVNIFITNVNTIQNMIDLNSDVVSGKLLNTENENKRNYICIKLFKSNLIHQTIYLSNMILIKSDCLANLKLINANLWSLKWTDYTFHPFKFLVDIKKVYGYFYEQSRKICDNYDKYQYSKQILIMKQLNIVEKSVNKTKVRYGFDKIFYINLNRRIQRKVTTEQILDEYMIEAERFEAVDGLNKTVMDKYKNKLQILRKDMTLGEIGCFLSHYLLWISMIKNNYDKIIIFEDDIKLFVSFRKKLLKLNLQIDELLISPWDLIYLGRKKIDNTGEEDSESYIDESKEFLRAKFSFGSYGYILSRSGARKLLKTQPLKHLVPVDEYLSYLSYAQGGLIAEEVKYFDKLNFSEFLSLAPKKLLLTQRYFSRSKLYQSDTEDSPKYLEVEQ